VFWINGRRYVRDKQIESKVQRKSGRKGRGKDIMRVEEER
jgi:hypothetical protein